jgi:uncharacterized RDD family membrane protein YckC
MTQSEDPDETQPAPSMPPPADGPPPADAPLPPPADGPSAEAPMPPPAEAPAAPPGGPPPSPGYLPPAPPVPAGYGYGEAGGVAVPPGLYFDQASGLLLPQGVELASSGRRIGAWFLAIPLAIVTLGIGYAIWGLIVWANGQTPALQVLGMRCWRPDDRRVPGWWWMALREVVGRFVEGILGIITLTISFVLMLTRPDRRCLHDLIAGTVVLNDPNKVLANPPA